MTSRRPTLGEDSGRAIGEGLRCRLLLGRVKVQGYKHGKMRFRQFSIALRRGEARRGADEERGEGTHAGRDGGNGTENKRPVVGE